MKTHGPQVLQAEKSTVLAGLNFIGFPINLCTIRPDAEGMGPHRRFEIGELSAAADWVCERNAEGYNVYWQHNAVRPEVLGKAKKSEILAARFVHADVDPPKGHAGWSEGERAVLVAEFEALPCPPSAIVNSGNGLQLYWRLNGECQNLEAIEDINRGVRDAVGADSGTWNADRLLRVPGTWNLPDKRKRGRGRQPVLASILSADSGEVFEPMRLLAAFPVQRAAAPTAERAAVAIGSYAPLTCADLGMMSTPLLRRAIERPEGNDRSSFGFHAACEGVRHNLTDAEIAGLLLNPINPASAHFLDQAAPVRAVERAIGAARANEPDAHPIPVETRGAGAALANRNTPPAPSNDNAGGRAFRFRAVGTLECSEPDFLVDGLLETSSLALVFGDPGCGKSFLAIDLACCIGTGTAFHGRAVKRGAVFYIAGEGHNGLSRRFGAWEKHNEQSLADAPVFASERAAGLLDAAMAREVAEAVDELAADHGVPRLIVVDTLARNFGDGDENNTKDMSAFVSALDRFRTSFSGATVLVVHHSGNANKDRARGAVALKAALDAEYRVAKVGNTISVVNTKMKEAAEPAPMLFGLADVKLGQNRHGQPYSSAVLISDNREAVLATNLIRGPRLAVETYASLCEGNAPHSVSLDSWREAFYAEYSGKTPDANRKSFQRARAVLSQAGALQCQDDVCILRLDHPHCVNYVTQ